ARRPEARRALSAHLGHRIKLTPTSPSGRAADRSAARQARSLRAPRRQRRTAPGRFFPFATRSARDRYLWASRSFKGSRGKVETVAARQSGNRALIRACILAWAIFLFPAGDNS